MAEDLNILLKKKMGYTEDIHTCSTCVYFKNNTNNIGTCNLNKAVPLAVNSDGNCNFWAELQNKLVDDLSDKQSVHINGPVPVNGPDTIPKVDLIKS